MAGSGTGSADVTVMRSRPRWWGVAALGVVAVALVAGAAVLVARADDPLDRSAFADVDADNAAAGTGPTGWYLPSDLPKGWAITGVGLVEPEPATRVRTPDDDPERPCACEAVTWTSPDGSRGITATMQPGSEAAVVTDQYGSALETEPHTFDWVDGVIGRVPSAEGDDEAADLRLVVVSDGTRVLQVAGQDQDLDTMQGMATEWVQNGLPELIGDVGSPEGWDLHSLGAARLGAAEPFVRVALETPDGPVSYDLIPTGTRPFLPGRSLGVLPETGPSSADAATGAATIQAEGADIAIGPVADGLEQGEVNKALAGALRPVSAEAWKAALADVDHDDAVDQPALARTSQLVVAGGETTRTATPHEVQRNSGRNVDGLELSLDLWSTDVIEGAPVGAHVLVRNTTERPIALNECNEAAFAWALVPPDDTDRTLPWRGYTDCYDSFRYEIPPGSTLRYPTDFGLATAHPPWRPTQPEEPEYGPGEFRAAVLMDGSRGSIRAVDPRTVTVRVSPCPPLPTAFVGADPDEGPEVQSYSEAEEAAAEAGLTLRMVKIGDEHGPVDCGRITAYAGSGGLVTFTRS